METLEQIAAQSKGEPRNNAQSYIRLMESPQFIVALVVVQFILSFTAAVTKILQAKECNLGDAYEEVNRAKECIRASRADDSWIKLWEKIQSIGTALGIEITKPRTAVNQRTVQMLVMPTKQVKIITESMSTILLLIVLSKRLRQDSKSSTKD